MSLKTTTDSSNLVLPERYKIQGLSNPFESKQTERKKAAMRLGSYSMADMTFSVSRERPQKRLCFRLFQVMHLKHTAETLMFQFLP